MKIFFVGAIGVAIIATAVGFGFGYMYHSRSHPLAQSVASQMPSVQERQRSVAPPLIFPWGSFSGKVVSIAGEEWKVETHVPEGVSPSPENAVTVSVRVGPTTKIVATVLKEQNTYEQEVTRYRELAAAGQEPVDAGMPRPFQEVARTLGDVSVGMTIAVVIAGKPVSITEPIVAERIIIGD